MLKYEVPPVYDIIMSLTQPDVFQEPSYLLVKLVCDKSTDPSFGKKKYFRYLEEYREQGLFCKRPKKLTPDRAKYYKILRKKKMTNFIIEHRAELELYKSLHSIGTKSFLKQRR